MCMDGIHEPDEYQERNTLVQEKFFFSCIIPSIQNVGMYSE